MFQEAQIQEIAKGLGALAAQVSQTVSQELDLAGITEADLEKIVAAIETQDAQKLKQSEAWYEQRVSAQQRQFKRY